MKIVLRPKKYVLLSLFAILFLSVFVGTFLIVKNLTPKKENKEELVGKEILEEVEPVINDKVVMIKPFTNEGVKVGKTYYDYKAESDKQEKSITYYNGSYKYNKKYDDILTRCANRDSVPQFFNGKYDYTCSYYNGRMEISNQDFLGVVLDYDGEYLTIEQRNYFKVGDSVEIFGPGKEVFSFLISSMYDIDGNSLEVARHPKEVIKIPINGDFSKWDLMRKK